MVFQNLFRNTIKSKKKLNDEKSNETSHSSEEGSSILGAAGKSYLQKKREGNPENIKSESTSDPLSHFQSIKSLYATNYKFSNAEQGFIEYFIESSLINKNPKAIDTLINHYLYDDKSHTDFINHLTTNRGVNTASHLYTIRANEEDFYYSLLMSCRIRNLIEKMNISDFDLEKPFIESVNNLLNKRGGIGIYRFIKYLISSLVNPVLLKSLDQKINRYLKETDGGFDKFRKKYSNLSTEHSTLAKNSLIFILSKSFDLFLEDKVDDELFSILITSLERWVESIDQNKFEWLKNNHMNCSFVTQQGNNPDLLNMGGVCLVNSLRRSSMFSKGIFSQSDIFDISERTRLDQIRYKMRLCKSDRDFYAREPYKLKLVSGKRFERSNTSESTEDYRNRISDAINYMTNESFTNNIFSMYDDKTAHAINIVIQKDGLYAFYDDNHGSFEYKSFDEFKHNFSGFLEAFYNYYYDFVVEQFKSAESIRSYKDEESDEISF